MIHYKDISWQESEESLQKFKKGVSVKAKLLEIDTEKEKIIIENTQTKSVTALTIKDPIKTIKYSDYKKNKDNK